MKKINFLPIVFFVAMTSSSIKAISQTAKDSAAVQAIIDEQVATWNVGDAKGYSNHFAEAGTFTNIQGVFAVGYQEFYAKHDFIFKGPFLKTVVKQKMVSMKFIDADAVVVETLTTVGNFQGAIPPYFKLDDKGNLHTRLLQVMVKNGKDWKIVAYHNVDIKPGFPVPE
jgi:uncharacterized protein (TIGR02246 family)